MQANREGETSKARSAVRSALVEAEADRLLPIPSSLWEGAQKRRNNVNLAGWKRGGRAFLKLPGDGVTRLGWRTE